METDVEAEPFLPAERLEQYRSSLLERCDDFVEDLANWAVRCKASILSSPLVRVLLVLVARVSFVADLALDINVGLELRASNNFWWSGICFSIIAFTYLVLVIALREIAVERLQSCCLTARPTAAMMLWFLLGVPLLIATDIFVTLRYLWQDPLDVEVFHFLKLRGLLEAVEAMLQTLLQSYVAFRLYNPGGFFAEVEANQVKPAALCLSIMFSIKNLGEQFLFLDKFSKLQTHGDRWLFLKTMCALGDGLAPSSLFDQVARSRHVNCEFDLGLVARSELWVLARAVRDSPVLEELRFAKASFLRVLVRSPAETSVLAGWVEELTHSRRLQRLCVDGTVIGIGPVDEEIWEAVFQVFQDSAKRMPLHSLQRIQVAGREPVLLLEASEPWRKALFQGSWQELRLKLQEQKVVAREVGEDLHVAAGLQRLTKHLGLLLSLGASANGDGKKLPLVGAALRNASGNAQLLLEHRADVDGTSGKGLTALYGAAQANAAQTLLLLLKHRAEVNLAIGPKKLTPLHAAARGTCNEALRLLLEHQAETNKANADGVTALHVACEASHLNALKSVEVLLAHRADVNVMTAASQRTPLHFALRSPSIALGTALLRPLLEHRANLNQADGFGNVPLCLAVEKDAVTAVQVLLENKAELHSPAIANGTPLHLAAECAAVESLKALLLSRADVSQVNKYGSTALLEAAAQNSVQCARVLLESRSDVNHCESGRGETALMRFGMRQSARGLRLLLEARADPWLKTTDGYRVDDLALSESTEIDELLKQALSSAAQ
ncbi:ANK3 [Symbiodinium sp. CCMP2456]|nr:ANK3 [Symbiodinium sp. CCMP2456]